MKKLILLLFPFTILSCDLLGPDKPTESTEPVEVTTKNYQAKSIEYLTGELRTNNRSLGLYKVTLEDGREVLLYNDARGIAMVQLVK
jgi:hypothetical protein